MNILFLSIVRFLDIADRGIYTDLIRKFMTEGHKVHVVYPSERRYKEQTGLKIGRDLSLLKVKTLNIQKTGFIEKGLAILILEWQFLYQIKKHYSNIKFDLVLYSTPPITFTNAVKYIKNRDCSTSYLLLKDIFPQNAVDLGLINKGGFLYKYFRKKEKSLYNISDCIGCMSQANVGFILNHNPQINKNKVEVNPNSIEPVLQTLKDDERFSIRLSYGITTSSVVCIYGGNLGIPQGIGFLIQVLLSNKENPNVFFVIVGDGTEYVSIERTINLNKINNVLLKKSLAKPDYDSLLLACDVGLIFLDKRFTIPNFPSRMLSYMEARIPMLAATDVNTDIGKIMEDNEFGFWAESGDLEKFNQNLNSLLIDKNKCRIMGENAYRFMLENYLVRYSYEKIMKRI